LLGERGWSRGEEERKKKINMVGPTFGGGNGGPPRMKAERGDLEDM
jgi:hypothetical protein